MWAVCLLFALVNAVFSENLRSAFSPQLSNSGIHRLVKRSSNIDPRSNIQDSIGDECDYRTNASTIIRTNISLSAGAAFLKFSKLRTRFECVKSCCYTQGCTVAVFETKGAKEGHDCYLFDCGNPSKCQFSDHDGYSAMMFNMVSVSQSEPQTQEEQHVMELENLETVTRPPAMTTIQTTRKTTTAAPREPVALYGQCESEDRCHDPHSACRSGVCVCEEGFHAKYGKCHNSSSQTRVENIKPQVPGDTNTGDDDTSDEAPDDDDDDLPDIDEAPAKADEQPAKIDKAPTESDKTKPAAEDDNKPASTETEEDDGFPADKIDSNPGDHMNADNNGEEKIRISFEETKHEVIVESPMDSTTLPIVALALGLAITFVLLLFVGCRLRTVKRRIRKGRALHSNEADYLINGMYL